MRGPFAAPMSPNQAQRQIGDQIEENHGDFIHRHAGIVNGIEPFERQAEPSAVPPWQEHSANVSPEQTFFTPVQSP